MNNFQNKVSRLYRLKHGKKIAKAQEKGLTTLWRDNSNLFSWGKDQTSPTSSEMVIYIPEELKEDYQIIPKERLNSNLIIRGKDPESGDWIPYIWDTAKGDWVIGYPLELDDVVVIGDASKVKQPKKTWAHKQYERLSYTPYVLSAADAEKMDRTIVKNMAFGLLSFLPVGELGALGGRFVTPILARGANWIGGKALQFGSKYLLPVAERGANWIGGKASQIAADLVTRYPWLVPAARGTATGAKVAWNYGARPVLNTMDYAFNPYRIMTVGDDIINGQRWLSGTKLGLKYGVRPWQNGIITDVAKGVGNVGTHLGLGYWGVEGLESLSKVQKNGWENTSFVDKMFIPFSIGMASTPLVTGVRTVINPSAANLGALGLVTTGVASNIAAGGYKFNSTPVGQYMWLGPLRFVINQSWENNNTNTNDNNTDNQE